MILEKTLEDANEAYAKQDFTNAFDIYKILAKNGNEDAQTSLAFMYQKAQGCTQNDEKAFELYTLAVEKEQPYALFNLAILYGNGLSGASHDQFKAHELYMKAAVLEVVPSMYELALMLERGLGCTQNYSEAAFWYEEGAKRGHLESFNNLGVLYKEGHGVDKNEAKCWICFSRASEGGLSQGHYNLGLLYDQGIGCEQNNDKALDLCRKAAHQGHKKAKDIIRGLQEDGKIVF